MLQGVFAFGYCRAGQRRDIERRAQSALQNDPRVGSLVDLSSPEGTYPQLSFVAARKWRQGGRSRAADLRYRRGTAIAANKVRGIRAATAHDLLTSAAPVENYDAQVLCMGQTSSQPGRLGIGRYLLDLRHDTNSGYAPKVDESKRTSAENK